MKKQLNTKKIVTIFSGLVLAVLVLAGCKKKQEVLEPYYGTYLPEIYITNVENGKSHFNAVKAFQQSSMENPTALFLSDKYVGCVLNFHEAYEEEILSKNNNSITVKSSDEAKTYFLEDKQFISINNIKYRKISNVQKIDEKVISNYLEQLLIPEKKLTDGNNVLQLVDNTIFYNEKSYEFGVDNVLETTNFDFIFSRNPYEGKYIEIKKNVINIFNDTLNLEASFLY